MNRIWNPLSLYEWKEVLSLYTVAAALKTVTLTKTVKPRSMMLEMSFDTLWLRFTCVGNNFVQQKIDKVRWAHVFGAAKYVLTKTAEFRQHRRPKVGEVTWPFIHREKSDHGKTGSRGAVSHPGVRNGIRNGRSTQVRSRDLTPRQTRTMIRHLYDCIELISQLTGRHWYTDAVTFIESSVIHALCTSLVSALSI